MRMVASYVGSRLLLLLLLLLAGWLIVLMMIEQGGREGGYWWGEEDQREGEEWQENRRKEEKKVMEKEGRDIVEEQEGIEWGEKLYFSVQSSNNELKKEHKNKHLKYEATQIQNQKGNGGVVVGEQADPYTSLMANSSTRDLVFLLAEVAALPPPSPPSPSCRPPPLPHRPTCDQAGTHTHNIIQNKKVSLKRSHSRA